MDLATSPATEDDDAFRARLRAWVDSNLAPEWRRLSRGGEDDELVAARRGWGRRLHDGGWAGPAVPERYGGLGLSVARQAIVIEEHARAGAPEPMNANAIQIFAPVLIRYGSESQRRRHLPPMLAHDAIWCQGFSEPDAGSDLAGLKTRASREQDGWRVHGQKVWTTYAHEADYCYLLARTDREAPKHAGITMMALDMRQPGVTVRPVRNIAGSTEFSEVFLDGALVSDDEVIGQPGSGWELARYALSAERGINFADRAITMSREFWELLNVLGAGGGDDALADRLVDSFIATRTMRSLVMDLLDRTAAGADLGVTPSVGKLHWSESHQELLRLGLEYLAERPGEPASQLWMQSFLFARGETIYGGTSEIQRNVIARALGLPSAR